MRLLSCIFLLLLSNCVLLNLHRTETLLKKEIVSTKEFETKEEELNLNEGKIISKEFLTIPIRRYLITKLKRETIYNSHLQIKEELSDSFIIIGGIIPFVYEEKGWGNYFKWAWIVTPVTIIDWISISFRTGTHEEIKTETETQVLKETKSIIADNSNLKIVINNVDIPIQNSSIIIPLSTILKNKTVNASDQFKKYELANYNFEYELKDGISKTENPNKINLPLNKVLSEKEFNSILLYEAVSHPDEFYDIYPHFINRISSKLENMNVIDKLLQAGINLNYAPASNISPLSHASRIGNLEIVKYLVEKGANINYNGEAKNNYSPLHQAILIGNYNLAKFLIGKGADVNYHGTSNIFPLHLAIDNPYLKKENSNLEIVKLLVENGANVNMPDSTNMSPLERAKDKPETAKYLQSKGAK